MRRWFVAAIGMACLILSCVGLLWAARSVQYQFFILNDARNIHIETGPISSTTIQYDVAGPPYTWRERLDQRLGQAGWQNHRYFFSGTEATFIADWYYRDHTFGPLWVRETATLAGTPTTPQTVWVRVQYQVRLNL